MGGWLSAPASDWIALKAAILGFVDLDRDAGHVVASVVALVVLAFALRRQIWSWLPWSSLLLLELLNEVASASADGILEEWELRGSLGDVLLVMALPTLLLAACRMVPGIVTSRTTILKPVPELPQSPRRRGADIVDAEFEEVSAE